MATDKTFKVFGVSKHEGEYKVRFANDMMRIKVLAKHGHTDIELVEVSEPITKYEGIKMIKDLPEFATAAYQSAIAEYLEDKAPKASKPAAKGVMKAPKAKAKAPAKTKVKAVETAAAATEDEEAPF